MTAGSVDNGKSTLIGRLLHDSRALADDQLDALRRASRRRHGEKGGVDLALVTDGLRAEREEGITIDVAYRYFATPRRTFIIADTPGHVSYTRNMVTGASTADLGIVLLDARHGVLEQSRRHLFIASLLGVRHVVVAVNKMDLVDWDEARFDEIASELGSFAARLDVADLRSSRCPRCTATTSWSRPRGRRGIKGRRCSTTSSTFTSPRTATCGTRGSPSNGSCALARTTTMTTAATRDSSPAASGARATRCSCCPRAAAAAIAAIETFDGAVEEAFAPMSVTLRLADDLDVSRGDVICRPHNRATVSRDIDATVCWMSERPARRGRPLPRQAGDANGAGAACATSSTASTSNTLHRDESAGALALNDIGRVRCAPTGRWCSTSYAPQPRVGQLHPHRRGHERHRGGAG